MITSKIFSISASDNYSLDVFVVAAKDESAAIEYAKETYNSITLPNQNFRKPVKISDNAVVEREGVLYYDGYSE